MPRVKRRYVEAEWDNRQKRPKGRPTKVSVADARTVAHAVETRRLLTNKVLATQLGLSIKVVNKLAGGWRPQHYAKD